MSSVSNGMYFLTLLLVSVMRVIYTSKGMSKKFGVRIIYQKNTVSQNDEIHMKHSQVLKNYYKKFHEVQQQQGINMNLNSLCFSQYL